MKSLFFSLSGVFAFILGILANLEVLLPESMVHASEPALPFHVEVEDLRILQECEGQHARGSFFVVQAEIRNDSAEDRVFPMSAVVVTDGHGETISQHYALQNKRNTIATRMPIAPGESRTFELCFDVPSQVRQPRLELEASAFADPGHGLVLGRRVLTEDLAGI